MSEIIKYKNTYVRKDVSIDKKMVSECLKNYDKFKFYDGDVVMDFGANIGGFAKMVEDKALSKYVGIEPDPENLDVAKMNIKDAKYKVCWYEGAASHIDTDYLVFYQTGSNNSACSGTATPSNNSNYRNGRQYKVKNYLIDKLLEEHRPDIVKMDIEGGELDWFKSLSSLPSYIRQMSIEFHRKEGMVLFDEVLFDMLRDDYEIDANPLHGFKSSGVIERFKNFEPIEGRVFGVDVFLTRK